MDESRIPSYKLFGESELWPGPEPVHYETIAERSSLYNWEITPHSHDNLFQILLLEQGHAGMTMETHSGVLPTPCIVMVAPRQVHGFAFSPDAVGHVVTLPQFQVAELLALSPELLDELKATRRFDLGDDAASIALLSALFARFRDEYSAGGGGRMSVLLALLTQILVWLARACGRSPARADSARAARRVDRFHELVERHFRESRPVAFYAERLGVSAAQLNNDCRRRTGRSAQRMIHDRVLLEARRLLAYSGLDVGRVGYSLGFRDPAYFSRFFARLEGVAPSLFRKLHGRDRQA